MTSKKKSRRITSGSSMTLTVKEAAAIAGVSERYIRKLVRDNVLRTLNLPGVVRFERSAFLRKIGFQNNVEK